MDEEYYENHIGKYVRVKNVQGQQMVAGKLESIEKGVAEFTNYQYTDYSSGKPVIRLSGKMKSHLELGASPHIEGITEKILKEECDYLNETLVKKEIEKQRKLNDETLRR